MKEYTVYCHTNLKNGKKYIGITCQDVKRRWRNGRGYDERMPFGRAIAKYGWDGFKHEIIACGLSEDEAKAEEIRLIQLFHTKDKHYGYNATDGGDGTAGFRKSLAERQQMSISRKGRDAGKNNPMYGRRGALAPHYGIPMSESAKKLISEGVKNAHKSGRYSSAYRAVEGEKNGTTVRFDSIAQAAESTNTLGTNISRCCRGKRRSANGYIWRYV